MSNTTYAYFKTYNHTGQLGVSSYALPFCKFSFVLDLDAIESAGLLSNKQVLWDYGDGTTQVALTGSHSYREPGSYQVTCYFNDNSGEAYLNTYARDVVVKNYIVDMITLSVLDTSAYTLSAGRIDVPITVTRTNSYQNYTGTPITIVPYASGANISLSYFDSASSKLYGHLEKYHAFYVPQTTSAGVTELVETEFIDIDDTKIYCKLKGGEVIHTTAADPAAFFCGVSGRSLVYFKEDTASSALSALEGFQDTLAITNDPVPDGGIFDIYPFSNQYEFDTNGAVAGAGIGVDISGDASLSAALIALSGAIDANETDWKVVSVTSGSITVENTNPGWLGGLYPGLPAGPGQTTLTYAWASGGIATASTILSAYTAPVNLYFGFKSDTFGVNTSTYGLSASILPNVAFDTLSITSNGIDGEGSQLTAFNINSNKYVGQKINFVAKVKDPDWYTIKDVIFTSYTTALSSPSGNVNSTFVVQSSANGYLKGYVVPLSATNNITIYITAALSGYNTTGALSGTSDTFDVFNTSPTIAKWGENVNMLDKYKSLRFQELFYDKVNLFDNFLGSIVGTISSGQNSIGKKVYEKITNFVDNHGNIEKCEIPQLVSTLQSIDEQNILFEKINFNYPAALKRLMDILSIKHSKLFGARNTFDLDFYNYGNQLLGNNLGSRITNTLNYTVSAGTDLVALEKYSGTFKKLDTNIPLSAASLSSYSDTYPLSAYTDDWGWYLVLNSGFTPEDLTKFYIFFEHDTYVNDIEESVINFTDGNTTLQHTASSYTEWKRDNGTIDKLIGYQLAQGLGLLSSVST